MSEFRKLTDGFSASPQITLDDLAEAKTRGFAMVVNNRPDGEAPDQTPGKAIEATASELGLAYIAIPIAPGGFTEAQVEAMTQALDAADGPVLAYCRSGTRSTLLWALVQAQRGRGVDEIADEARKAGYDVSPIRPALEMYAARKDR